MTAITITNWAGVAFQAVIFTAGITLLAVQALTEHHDHQTALDSDPPDQAAETATTTCPPGQRASEG